MKHCIYFYLLLGLVYINFYEVPYKILFFLIFKDIYFIHISKETRLPSPNLKKKLHSLKLKKKIKSHNIL